MEGVFVLVSIEIRIPKKRFLCGKSLSVNRFLIELIGRKAFFIFTDLEEKLVWKRFDK